jgi:ribonuclease BN (tRNA processing enzyme)
MVHEDACVPSQAAGLIEKMESFQFVFILKLMLKLLGITNELSHLLQRKDINIVNALEVSTLFLYHFISRYPNIT